MKVISIDAAELKAVCSFSAQQDVRYYLNGVLVQASASQTRLVATDGHILGIFDHAFENEGVTFEEIIIPTDVIKGFKVANKNLPVQIIIENGQYRIQQLADQALIFKPVDAKYPDYTRIIPAKVNEEYAQFGGQLLAKIDKAQRVFSTKAQPYIWHNGLGGAPFALGGQERFMGVVMPFSQDKKRTRDFPDLSAFRRGLEVKKTEAEEAPAAATEADSTPAAVSAPAPASPVTKTPASSRPRQTRTRRAVSGATPKRISPRSSAAVAART